MGIHPVIEEDTHDAAGQDRQTHLEPQLPGGLLSGGGFLGIKGIELVEENDDDRQNGAQLDDHIEHGLEFLGGLELDEFVQQDDVTGGGHGQPFGDALDDAEEHRLENFKDKHGLLLSGELQYCFMILYSEMEIFARKKATASV